MEKAAKSKLFNFYKGYFVDRPGDDPCSTYNATLLLCTGTEIFFLVVLSHLLHLLLKRFGQPSTVSQMLAGFFLGPTILGQFDLVIGDKRQLDFIASAARVFFMFLVALEIDIACLRRTLRSGMTITLSNAVACVPACAVVGPTIFRLIHSKGYQPVFIFCFFLIFFNTASPILIRVVNELKLTMTEMGRLAVSTALFTDVLCLASMGMIGFIGVETSNRKKGMERGVREATMILGLVLMVLCSFAIRFLVNRASRRNAHRRQVGDGLVFYLLSVVVLASLCLQYLGFDPMIGVFVFGLVIQKDGPTARNIADKLTYGVENLILPVYFGVAGLQVDIEMLKHSDVWPVTLAVIFIGTFAKIGGTLVGAKLFLGMPVREGLVLSFLLNIRGHVNLIILTLGLENNVWDENMYMALLISLFFNSITACPATVFIVRQERQAIGYRFKGLEWLNPENELRILACVHSPLDVPPILDLVEISSGPNQRLVAPYILHLRELTGSSTSTMLYHQVQGNQSGNNSTGGTQPQQVNAAMDTFVRETGINLRQINAMSSYESMHKDLQNGVQEVHASLAVVPFHCKRRFDGKMGIGKEEIRQFNLNVLRHAPCSVGILIDRGLGRRQGGDGFDSNGMMQSSSLSLSMSAAAAGGDGDASLVLHVVVLFLGGPDDREAVAYAGRLAVHPCVNLTLVRFLPTFRQAGSGVYLRAGSSSSESSSVAMDVEEGGQDADETFMSNFYNRFVVTGMVTYVERLVENSTELIAAMSSMEGMYSLYIVGRQRQGPTAWLTVGMSQWEECPELGSIGDMLASSDFMVDGSVLVIQQHNIATASSAAVTTAATAIAPAPA